MGIYTPLIQHNAVPDGGWAWIITAAAFLLWFLKAIPGISFGILFSCFLIELGASSTMTAWIFSLTHINASFTSYIVGPLVEEFGWRKVVLVASMVYASGMMLSAFATSASGLILTLSFLAGCSMNFGSNVASLMIPVYFCRWRMVAFAVSISGVAVSQIVIPPVITYLQEEYGMKGATIIIGALILNCCVAAMVLHPVHWHAKDVHDPPASSLDADLRDLKNPTTLNTELQHLKTNTTILNTNLQNLKNPTSRRCLTKNTTINTRSGETMNYATVNTKLHNLKKGATAVSTNLHNSKRNTTKMNTKPGDLMKNDAAMNIAQRDLTKNASKCLGCATRIIKTIVQYLQYLKSPSVVLTSISVAMVVVVLYNVFALVPFEMHSAGFSQQEASFCMSVTGGCNLAARLSTPALICCPKVRVRLLYLSGSCLAAIGIIGFSVASSLTGKVVSMGVCGVGYGLTMSLFNMVIVDELGLSMMAPTISTIGFMEGLNYLIIGPLSGWVRDVSGSYMVCLCFCAACLLFSVILGLFIPLARSLEQRSNDLK